MAHQRTVTKNRYIFFIISQGKKIHILYAYTGDQNTKDESQERLRANSVMFDNMKVHRRGASTRLTGKQSELRRAHFVSVDFPHLEPPRYALRPFVLLI